MLILAYLPIAVGGLAIFTAGLILGKWRGRRTEREEWLGCAVTGEAMHDGDWWFHVEGERKPWVL